MTYPEDDRLQAMSRVHSGNNAVSVVSAASVVGVGGDVGGVGDGSERIHVYDDDV